MPQLTHGKYMRDAILIAMYEGGPQRIKCVKVLQSIKTQNCMIAYIINEYYFPYVACVWIYGNMYLHMVICTLDSQVRDLLVIYRLCIFSYLCASMLIYIYIIVLRNPQEVSANNILLSLITAIITILFWSLLVNPLDCQTCCGYAVEHERRH